MRSRAERSRRVVTGSLWYLVATGIMAAGGFVAWALAARLQAVDVVGSATALFASLLFVVYATNMGLPVAVARFAHGDPVNVERLWAWAVGYAAATATLGTAVFVIVGPRLLGPEVTGPLASTPGGWLLFLGLVLGMSWAAVTEMRFVTIRAWPWVVGRVVIISIVRVPLLFTTMATEPVGLFLIMAGPAALSGAVGIGAFAIRRTPHLIGQVTDGLGEAWRFATVSWLGTLASRAPQLIAPLVVASAVSPTDNAGFYLAWSITAVMFLIPQTISQVVVSEASRAHGQLRRQFRSGLELGLSLTVAATLAVWAGSSLVTTVFGNDYQTTAEVLPLLCAGTVPWTVTSLCLAVTRVRNDWTGTIAIAMVFALLTLAPIVVMVGPLGVTGASLGWMVGNICAALVAVVMVLGRERRHQHASAPSPSPAIVG
jgi:O-antigen/teichoic acid export membrane protein